MGKIGHCIGRLPVHSKRKTFMKKHVSLKKCMLIGLMCCTGTLAHQQLNAVAKLPIKPCAEAVASIALPKSQFEAALNDVVAADGKQYKDAQGNLHGTMGMLNAI